MNAKIVLIALVAFAVAESAVIRGSNREGRTLGLLSVGSKVLGTGVTSAKAAALSALGVTAAAQPLVLLGLGKYALWNYLNRPGQHMAITLGYKAPDASSVPTTFVNGPQVAPAPVTFIPNESPVSFAPVNNVPVVTYGDNSFDGFYGSPSAGSSSSSGNFGFQTGAFNDFNGNNNGGW